MHPLAWFVKNKYDKPWSFCLNNQHWLLFTVRRIKGNWSAQRLLNIHPTPVTLGQQSARAGPQSSDVDSTRCKHGYDIICLVGSPSTFRVCIIRGINVPSYPVPFPRSSFDPFSAGIVFRRQNMSSVDDRFWRLKSIPAL